MPKRRREPTVLRALSALSALSVLSVTRASDVSITVDTPGDQAAGSAFLAQWTYLDGSAAFTTGDFRDYDIDLHWCVDGGCDGDTCGEFAVSLCAGCSDASGDFEVHIPPDTPGGLYKLKVAATGSPDVFDCSETFTVSSAAGPTLSVVSPDDVEAGGVFTAQWEYDDGAGGTSGSFDISLHACADDTDCAGDGACGNLFASLCEGCFSPTGSYDVRIPAGTPAGLYSLVVAEVGGDVEACHDGPFSVVDPAAPDTPAPSAAAPPPPVPTVAPAPAATPAPTAPAAVAATAAPTAAPTAVTVAPTPLGVTVTGPWGTPPPVPEVPPCNHSIPVEIRWSASSNRIYLEHTDGTVGGCLTMSDIYEARRTTPNGTPMGPLYPVNVSTGLPIMSGLQVEATGVWLLTSDLYVTNGVTLRIRGGKKGGCDELRLLSTDDQWVNVRGYGADIVMKNTKVTSWDNATASVRELELPALYPVELPTPRSYISCISEVADLSSTDPVCEGGAKENMGECRMTVIDSEVSYLGYPGSEAYGLSWKVRGLCKDLSNLELMDEVNVWGDIINSNIHHCWHGAYAYGLQSSVVTMSTFYENHENGIDMNSDSDYLTIHNNTVYNNGVNGIALSGRCDHATVTSNAVYGNTENGIRLHQQSDYGIVTDNLATANVRAGLSLSNSSHATALHNDLVGNEIGVAAVSASFNTLSWNAIKYNLAYGLYIYSEPDEVSGELTVSSSNDVWNNTITGTYRAVRLADTDLTYMRGNYFEAELDKGLFLEFNTSTDVFFANNDGVETSPWSGELGTLVSVQADAKTCFSPGSQPIGPTCSSTPGP